MKLPVSAALLLAGCASTGLPSRTVSREPRAYTLTPQVAMPVGALSTGCRFDANGLGADCRPLDRDVEGPIAPISAGQVR